MPKLRMITVLFVVLLLCLIYFLIVKKYILSLMLFSSLVVVFLFMKRLLEEELLIHWLYKQGSEAKVDSAIRSFPKSGKNALERLTKKKIVEKRDNRITLIISDYRFSVTKGGIGSE